MSKDPVQKKAIRLSRRTVISGIVTSIAASNSIINADSATNDIQYGNRNLNEIALTFHGAGDDSINREILNLLNSLQISITIFAVGNWLKSSPDLAKKFYDSGHEFGNHTLNHKSMLKLSNKIALEEVRGGALELKKLFGFIGIGFRPSGTQFSNSIIRSAAKTVGYDKCISYDVDSRDFEDPPVQKIIENIDKDIRPGSIVSLHLGHSNTLKALPKIISLLDEKKYKPVKISKLLM